MLHARVAAMPLHNFVVRPKRRLVEEYAQEKSWEQLSPEKVSEVGRELAPLPTTLSEDDEEAKRFDLLILRTQLAILRAEPGFPRLREQIQTIVGMLEEQGNIPAVREQMVLIQHVVGEESWQEVTVPILESTRKRRRLLMKLIENRNGSLSTPTSRTNSAQRVSMNLVGCLQRG